MHRARAGAAGSNVVTGTSAELAAKARAAQPWAQRDAIPPVLQYMPQGVPPAAWA